MSSLVHCLQRGLDLLLGTGARRRRNTTMTALATTMMVCCTLVMRMLTESSGLNAQVVQWWAGLAPVGMLVILVLVRSGWSERCPDPSLSQFQMMWALSFNAIAYVIAGPVRALALPVLVIIMMFGIFGRNRRQILSLMLFAMVVYSLAILVTARLDTPAPASVVLLAHLAIVLSSLLTSTLMCLQVQSIRAYLRRQKQELQEALQQIQTMAMRDHLTGLANRRQMSELLELERNRHQRGGRAPLLAQLDIDHFKNINDTHGHSVGDLALQAFAETAAAHLRSSDVLARWGGEEFVLLLCDTPPSAAHELLERVRNAVAAHSLSHGAVSIRMTVSIGWTQHVQGEPLEQTLERADRALYSAKRHGRNRVVCAPLPATPVMSAVQPPAPAADTAAVELATAQAATAFTLGRG